METPSYEWSPAEIIGWHIVYSGVCLVVVIGGAFGLHWLWPHLGQLQWVFLGWKLWEAAGWDPLAFTLWAAAPCSLVLGEYARRLYRG